MVYCGAKQVGSPQTNSGGDIYIDLIDPFGMSDRLIKRRKSVLDR